MKRNLRIVYDGPPDWHMDEVLTTILKAYGWLRWASGVNHRDKLRDIQFEKVVEDDETRPPLDSVEHWGGFSLTPLDIAEETCQDALPDSKPGQQAEA